MSNREDLKLLHFILNMRLKDRRNLYVPKSRCGDGNFIHSDYVYMRANLDFSGSLLSALRISSSDNLRIKLKDIETCNNLNMDLPCIKIERLNELIKEDNQILREWSNIIDEEIQAKEQDKEYQKFKQNVNANYNFKYNRDYTRSFYNTILDAISFYSGTKYSKNSFNHLPISCNKRVTLSIYEDKYKSIVNQITRGKDLGHKEPDLSYFPDVTSFIYTDDVGIDNAELQSSRELLQKILQQISSIEMKSRLNKTKIKTLIGQYGMLKQIRKRVDKHIGLMQKRIDDLNTIRGKNDAEMENLQSKIRRLQMSKKNLQQEIKDIMRRNELSSVEKSEKISKLNNVKTELEEQNTRLKREVVKLRNNKQIIEDQNKKFQNELQKAKKELSATESNLKNISTKLNTLNIDADKPKIDDQLLEPMEEQKDLEALPELKPYKKSKSKKVKQGRKKKLEESEELDVPKKLKRKRKPKRQERVEQLDLFPDEEEEEVQQPSAPKRKRGRPRKSTNKSKKIKVKVKKRKRKSKKEKEEDDELVFNFSLRNFM